MVWELLLLRVDTAEEVEAVKLLLAVAAAALLSNKLAQEGVPAVVVAVGAALTGGAKFRVGVAAGATSAAAAATTGVEGEGKFCFLLEAKPAYCLFVVVFWEEAAADSVCCCCCCGEGN